MRNEISILRSALPENFGYVYLDNSNGDNILRRAGFELCGEAGYFSSSIVDQACALLRLHGWEVTIEG